MDSTQFAVGGGAVGIASVLFIIMTRIYNACNHKRLRSNCCGKDLTVSVDVEETTPPAIKKPQLQEV